MSSRVPGPVVVVVVLQLRRGYKHCRAVPCNPHTVVFSQRVEHALDDPHLRPYASIVERAHHFVPTVHVYAHPERVARLEGGRRSRRDHGDHVFFIEYLTSQSCEKNTTTDRLKFALYPLTTGSTWYCCTIESTVIATPSTYHEYYVCLFRPKFFFFLRSIETFRRRGLPTEYLYLYTPDRFLALAMPDPITLAPHKKTNQIGQNRP